jgi:hypothetical protein
VSAINWPTLIVAIVGAITGLISLGWKIYTHVSDRPRLTLFVQVAEMIGTPEGDGRYVVLNAGNNGKYPITIRSAGFDLSNRKVVFTSPNRAQRLPFEVLPGRAYEAWIKLDSVEKGLAGEGKGVKIAAAFAYDATGKRWRRKLGRRYNRAFERKAVERKAIEPHAAPPKAPPVA